MVRASSMPEFEGTDVTKIVLYRKTASGWELIPSQIDEIKIDTLKNYLTGTCVVEAPICERNVILQGTAPDGFSETDELVFMARDSGSAASTSDWVGVPGTDTATRRYRLMLHDTFHGEYGTVYAYRWIRPTNPPPTTATDYVTWFPDPANPTCIITSGNQQYPDPACGWLRSTDQGSQGSLPRFNSFLAGNWTVGAMCIKPYASDVSCAVSNGLTNMIDQLKWRTTIPIENERGWDHACRAFIGVKDGAVRVVRRIMGALSGRFTTKTEYFYGTWFQQKVNLRVHEIGSVAWWVDHRPKNPLDPETPNVVFTRKHSDLNNRTSMDVIDGNGEDAVNGAFPDWVQIDTSRGTYLQFLEEIREIADATRSFEYTDGDAGGHEYVPGTYGQFGFKWAGDPCFASTQDVECLGDGETDPDLIFASLLRTLIPLGVDSPSGDPSVYRSEEGSRYEDYFESPIVVSPYPEEYGAGGSPPVGPCTPSLTGAVNDGAYSSSLSASTGSCAAPDVTGVALYRGTVPGVYSFFADLGKATTFVDHAIRLGVTYRYIARAYDANGNLGPASPELVLTPTDTVPPPVPTGLTASPGSGKVILSWTGATDRDTRFVVVHVSEAAGGLYAAVNLSDPIGCGDASFAVSGLAAGRTYWFRLTARDGRGNESDYSGEVHATPF